jgi:hypothetical protein
MAVRPLLIAFCILPLSVCPALSKGSGSSSDHPWNHEHIESCPPTFAITLQKSARGRLKPSTTSLPTCQANTGGASILNTFDARGSANIDTATNVSTLTSLP